MLAACNAGDRRSEAYWRIGERIAAEKLTSGAGYHNSILRELASDTGASIRTLQRSVTLHEYYRAPPASFEAAWGSQYPPGPSANPGLHSQTPLSVMQRP